jgi:hypothetical protein
MMTETELLGALHSELVVDPTELGYAPHIAAGEDQLLADMLNAPRYPFLGRAELDTIQAYMQSQVAADSSVTRKDIYMRVTELAQDAGSPVQVACQAVIQLFEKARFNTVDLALPRAQELLTVLEAAGVISAEQLAVIESFGSRNISRAEQLFGLGVTVSHLQIASTLRGV